MLILCIVMVILSFGAAWTYDQLPTRTRVMFYNK